MKTLRRLGNWLGFYLTVSAGTGVPVCLILAIETRDPTWLLAGAAYATLACLFWMLWWVWYNAGEE